MQFFIYKVQKDKKKESLTEEDLYQLALAGGLSLAETKMLSFYIDEQGTLHLRDETGCTASIPKEGKYLIRISWEERPRSMDFEEIY